MGAFVVIAVDRAAAWTQLVAHGAFPVEVRASSPSASVGRLVQLAKAETEQVWGRPFERALIVRVPDSKFEHGELALAAAGAAVNLPTRKTG